MDGFGTFHYMHSVFQPEARIFINFSKIQPKNMLKICLSRNIQKNKFHDLIHTWGDEVGRGYQNEEILKFLPSRLLQSLS